MKISIIKISKNDRLIMQFIYSIFMEEFEEIYKEGRSLEIRK